MPVYHGDDAAHFDEALRSICDQSFAAREIIVVQDGPVGEELTAVLHKHQESCPLLRLVKLERNSGLSTALNAGIDAAQYEWIARMDADDVAHPDRFERQAQYLKQHPEISILGSWIDEYDESLQQKTGIRKLPETHYEILKYARWRCPFNHMTVMYKTEVVRKLGKYKNYGAVGDDYELWGRFLTQGYRGANLQEVLVDARTGEDFFGRRRRGWKYLRNEIREVNDLRSMGLIGPVDRLVHIGVKGFLRLSPPFLLRGFYKLLRRTS